MKYLSLILMDVLMILVWVDLPAWSPSRAYAMEKGELHGTEAVTRVIRGDSAAVVHIAVIRRAKSIFPFWFYDMNQLLGRPEDALQTRPHWQNSGTGVLIDAQGHILTNYHLVGEAKALYVWQTDSRKFPAVLLGADPKTDLAVIRLLVHQPVNHAVFGDSDKAHIGDRVVSIGYGIHGHQIVNIGIITAKARAGMRDLYSLHDLMRVDMPVHSGHTGGPLFNLQGQIVGINSALMTRFSDIEGVDLAIPVNLARMVAQKLIQKGKMERGWLGAMVQDVSPYFASPAGRERPEGALVIRVVRGGPADMAGLKAGDLVTGYRDRAVLGAEDFQRAVAGSTAGEKVHLTVIRNGQRQRISAVVGDPKETISDPAFFIRNRLGVDVRPATSKEAKRYGLGSRQGMVIVGFYPGSPLSAVGFELNDMIMEVEGRPVKGLKDFMDQIVGLRRKHRVIMLGLNHRTGQTGFVQVVVP